MKYLEMFLLVSIYAVCIALIIEILPAVDLTFAWEFGIIFTFVYWVGIFIAKKGI